MIASERITVPVDGAAPRSARTAANVGRVCTGLVALFLAFDTVLKVLKLGPAVEGTMALGYPADSVQGIGIIELVCLVLYLVPRTSVLGGLLLTGTWAARLPPTCASPTRCSPTRSSRFTWPLCSGEGWTYARSGYGPSCRCGI